MSNYFLSYDDFIKLSINTRDIVVNKYQESQKNNIKYNCDIVWKMWIKWIYNNDYRKRVLKLIGIDEQQFFSWFLNKRHHNPLPHHVDFYEILFEYFYEKTYQIKRIKKTMKSFLYFIGLHKTGVNECMHQIKINRYDYQQNYITPLIYVFSKMIDSGSSLNKYPC